MHIVDLELAKDVLAVGVDGVEAAETFFRNFLGRQSQRDVFQYFRLSLGQPNRVFSMGQGLKQELGRALTDIAAMVGGSDKGRVDFCK